MEMVKDSASQILQGGEVSVVGTEATGHLPNPFDGIEVGAVRGQEIETEHVAMFPQPRFKVFGVMIASVVQDEDDLASVTKVAQELFQEQLEGRSVELDFLPRYQLTIRHTDGAENAEALARGGVFENRIDVFARDPHRAP